MSQSESLAWMSAFFSIEELLWMYYRIVRCNDSNNNIFPLFQGEDLILKILNLTKLCPSRALHHSRPTIPIDAIPAAFPTI